jgi:hypothetical protein
MTLDKVLISVNQRHSTNIQISIPTKAISVPNQTSINNMFKLAPMTVVLMPRHSNNSINAHMYSVTIADKVCVIEVEDSLLSA